MKKFFQSIIVAFLLMSGCGQSQGTARVKIVTGLEPSAKTFDFFSRLNRIPSFSFFSAQTCNQTQVYVAWGLHSNSGGGTQGLSTFPVSIATPITDGTAGTLDSQGPETWLGASTVSTISLDVPMNQTLDFGVGGSLTPATAPDSNGNCPLMQSANVPYPSFSMLGHTSTTVSSNTTVPVALFITDAQPSAAYIPQDPGGVCDQDSNNGGTSQQCANSNFRQIFVKNCTSTPCNSAISAGYVKINSFTAANGPQMVNQYVKLSTLTSANGAMIADIGPFQFTVFNSAGTPVLNGSYSDSGGSVSSPAPTPYFSDGVAYVVANDGAGQRPPGGFNISGVNYNSGTSQVTVNWGIANNANTYTITQIGNGTSLTCNTTPSVLNSTAQSATVSISASCISTSLPNIFVVDAVSINGKHTLSAPFNTNATVGVPVLNTPSQVVAGASLSWNVDPSAISYDILWSSNNGAYTVCTSALTATTYVASANCYTAGLINSYEVKEHGLGGTATSAPQSITMVGPGTTTAAGGATGTVILSGLNNLAGATSFIAKYGTTSGTHPSSFPCGAGPTCTITGLTPATTYYFVVDGINSNNGSYESTESSATAGP